MRLPPALQVPCVSAPGWRHLQAVAMGVTAAVVVAWWASHAELDPRMCWALALITGAIVTTCAHRLLRPLSGTLRWDGTAWHWQAEASASAVPLLAVDITIDLQRALLLRLRTMPPPPSRRARSLWLALNRVSVGAQWSALCATINATRGVLPGTQGGGVVAAGNKPEPS